MKNLIKTSFISRSWEILSKGQRRLLVYLIVFVIIGTFLETLSLGLIIPVLNMFYDSDYSLYRDYLDWIPFLSSNQDIQIFLLLSLITAYIIKGIFLTFLTWFQNRFSFSVTADISNRLFGGYLKHEYKFHLYKKSADLIRNLTSEVGTFTAILTSTVIILSEISIILSIVILLFLVNPMGALTAFSVLATLAFIFSKGAKKYNIKWGKQRHIHDSLKLNLILQAFDGIKEVKHYQMENIFIDQYIENNIKLLGPSEKQYTLQALPRIFFEVVAVTVCLSYILGETLSGSDVKDLIPQIGLLIAAAFRLMPSFNRIISASQTFRFAEVVLENISKEIKEIQFVEDSKVENSSDLLKIEKEISLNKVCFKYRTGGEIFTDLDFTIAKNEFIAVIGQTGAGKSTLIDLILGLLIPDQGLIKIDKNKISEDLNNWRKIVGYVPQAFYLFNESIEFNISLTRNSPLDKRNIWKAIELAQLKGFVNGLENGIQSVVGEKGSLLSGGQKQRLAIARALYRKPKVLIMDEPTSSLDKDTELGFMKSLDELRRQIDITIIIITHSDSNKYFCDKVVEIKNNKLKIV